MSGALPETVRKALQALVHITTEAARGQRPGDDIALAVAGVKARVLTALTAARAEGAAAERGRLEEAVTEALGKLRHCSDSEDYAEGYRNAVDECESEIERVFRAE